MKFESLVFGAESRGQFSSCGEEAGRLGYCSGLDGGDLEHVPVLKNNVLADFTH